MLKTCMSYWFPKLLAAGIPVPKTAIIKTDIQLRHLLDNAKPDGFDDFISILAGHVKEMGLPAFLRTGMTSGKHDWKRTCCVTDVEKLPEHVGALVMFSEMADFLGLPHDVWVVREMLPTKPIAVLPEYSDMPLVPEIRAFVRGGAVVCWHPYWPLDAIKGGLARDDALRDTKAASLDVEAQAVLSGPHADIVEQERLVNRVAKVFADDGAWSVDLLPTEKGWFVTDMAEAARSYHWEGCEEAESFLSTK